MRLAVLIPTYNEEAYLTRFIDSLEFPEGLEHETVVINAGKPLGAELASRVTELKVPDEYFWTASMQAGFDYVAEKGDFDYAMMGNADTILLPGSIEALVAECEKDPRYIACCPAYMKLGDEEPTLHYSDQKDWGFLLYGKMVKRWERYEDRPSEPFDIQIIGGQGVLFPARFCKLHKLDPARFPQASGDHDFWHTLRRKEGVQLRSVPAAGSVNLRQMGVQPGRKKGFFRRIWQRMWSDKTGDSAPLMWRLRRKHLGPVLAVPSTFFTFVLRYTIGFPKMLKRL